MTLAERSAQVGAGDPSPAPSSSTGPSVGTAGRALAPGTRHVFVVGLPGAPGRWSGLLAEWKRDPARGGWSARVVYAVDDDGPVVLIEAWVPAAYLLPANR